MGENILSKSEGIQAKRFKEGKEFKKEEKYDKEEKRVKKKINNIAIDCLISKGWVKDSTYLFLETSNNSLQKDISGFKIIEDRKIGESSLKIYLKTHY